LQADPGGLFHEVRVLRPNRLYFLTCSKRVHNLLKIGNFWQFL
jgi:hypothetical protein